MYNFAKASVADRTELTNKLDAIQKDAMKLLGEGGITKFNAATEWRGEAAALVRETVIDTFKLFDPTPIFTERRTGQHGDRYEFEQLINTLRVVEYSPQSVPTIFTPRKGVWTISTSMFELAFGIPLQKVMNGQHTIGEFATLAGQATLRHYAGMTMAAVNTACATGATDLRGRPLRTAAGASDVTKVELDAALKRMYASNTGLTIFGNRTALSAIYDFTGQQSINLADELNARGAIGVYKGAKLVEIENDHNLFYNAFESVNGINLDKLIFIASGTKGAIMLEKDMSSLSWELMDVRAAQWSSGIRFETGILVHTPSRYHVVQLA